MARGVRRSGRSRPSPDPVAGPLGGTLLLALVWAGWHFPQFLMPEWADQSGGLSAATIVLLVATTPGSGTRRRARPSSVAASPAHP